MNWAWSKNLFSSFGSFPLSNTDGSNRLPFLLPNTCALGIAVKSYLDELLVQPDPTSPEAKAAVKETAATRYFPQCQDLVEDLETAFKLWDAVSYKAIAINQRPT